VELEVSFKCEEVSPGVVRCSWVKCSEGLSNRVSTVIRRYIYRSHEVCCLYGLFVYCILSYSFGSILMNVYMYGCMFYMLLFNFVNYVFLLLRLCILIVMYVLYILLLCVVLCIVCV
jgi:hypothetical protein